MLLKKVKLINIFLIKINYLKDKIEKYFWIDK